VSLLFQQIRIGNTVVEGGLKELDVWRSRKDPAGYAAYVLREEVEVAVEPGAIVEIDLGYDEKEVGRVFTGAISRSAEERVIAKDGMTQLLGTSITQSFMQATPQDMIKFGLKLAGVEAFSLSSQVFGTRDQVVAGLNVYDMIRQRINPYWGVDFAAYFDARDVFIWQAPVKNNDMYLFQYGENILEMLSDGDIGMFRTVFVPGLDHSQYITLSHPGAMGVALIETVHHYILDDKLRTDIYYKLESE